MRRLLIGSLTSLLMFGCHGGGAQPPCTAGTYTDQAHLCPDRLSLGFDQEYNSATYLGTSPRNSLSIRNGGTKDLLVESVQFEHDAAFDVCDLSTSTTQCKRGDGSKAEFAVQLAFPDGATAPPSSIAGNKQLIVTVDFTPKLAKQYSFTLHLKTNAENAPPADAGCGDDWCFQVSGCGLSLDGGSSCYPRAAGP